MAETDDGFFENMWREVKALKYEYVDGLDENSAQNKAKYGMTKSEAYQGLKDWLKDNELVWIAENPEKSIQNLSNLVAAGANVDIAADNGCTALMILSECVPQSKEVQAQQAIKYLLSHGADINKQDKDGMTPLMHSLRNINELGGNVAIVGELLKHHPDLTLKNNSGNTAADVVKALIKEAAERGDTAALARYEKVEAMLREEEKRQIGHEMHNQEKMTKSPINSQDADIQIDNRYNARQETKSQTRENMPSRMTPMKGGEER